MTVRTLFLNHSATMGGAEYGLLDLARSMSDRALVLLFEDGHFRQELENAGVPVDVLRTGAFMRVRRDSIAPGASVLTSLWRAAREVAALADDFDVMHANSQKALIVGALATFRTRTPLVWHLHDIIEPPFFSRLNVLADITLANHRVDRVIAVSQATADAFVRQGGDHDKVHVVYNGIDPTPFDATASAAGQVRDDMGLSDVPVVGCFSRMAEWKGQHVLIEAIAELPDVHALLVGGPLFGEHAYERKLRNLVRERGLQERVHFLGQRADVPALMRNVDLIVHPSTAPEPFARTLIEAMFSGHAPIASACGGVPELISSGVNGYLFPPGDVRELRALIRRLLVAPAELARVAATARLHAQRYFSMPRYVEEVTGQLRAAAASRAGATETAEPFEVLT